MQATQTTPATLVTFTCPYCEHKVEGAEVKDGDVLTCTNPLCQKQFQAELPRVHPDPELIVPDHFTTEPKPVAEMQPVVSEIHTVPAEAESPATPTTGTTIASSMAPPEVVALYRPPMFFRHPVRFLVNLGLILLGLAGLVESSLIDSHVLFAVSLLPLVYGLARQLVWWLRARRTSLMITTRGVVITEGLWSSTLREIYHDSIHGIHIFQPWWARLLNTGALMLTFGDDNEQIYLDSVPEPQKVAELIREHAKK
jgi:hypothetical protein